MNRRKFFVRAGLAATAGAVAASCRNRQSVLSGSAGEWDKVREQFNLAPDQIDLSALFIASHPKPVRDGIQRHRLNLDENPIFYLREQLHRHENEVLEAASRYLGANPADIALTDSTTMGLGLVYSGLKLLPGQQIITTLHDYYATHESLRLAAERSSAQIREIRLYQQEQTVTPDEIGFRSNSPMSVKKRLCPIPDSVKLLTDSQTPFRYLYFALNYRMAPIPRGPTARIVQACSFSKYVD